MKKITINDIAKKVGVAKSTVSRYLNGGVVKDETKKIIEKAIEETNYKPNAFARLKAKQKKIIGLIMPRLDSPTASRMVVTLERDLRLKGYLVLIINTDNNQKTELENIENLWRMNVDGIIIVATTVTKKHEEYIENLDIPIIFVGQKIKNGISIVHNDFEAGMKIGEYLGERISSNIMYLCIDKSDMAIGIERKRGILEGLKNKGVTDVKCIHTDFTFNKTYKIVKDEMKKKRSDAIICSTDLQALAVYKVANELGIKIPEELSITGFGGYEVSELVSPKLTTIRLDSKAMGHITAETMMKLLNGEVSSKTQIVDFTFLEGGSVKK